MEHEYSVHGRLSIRSDVNLGLPSSFKAKLTGTSDMTIRKGFKKVSDVDYVFPPYVYHKKGMVLHRYGFVAPCQLTLEDLEGKTAITYTDVYKRLIGIKGLVECVLDIKLLQKGFAKTHASCVELQDGTGVMVAGWDHSGKSTIAINMMNGGAKFLADDITLITEDGAYSYPKNIKAFTGMYALAKKLNSIPFVNRTLGLNKGVQPKNITGKTKVKYLFISRYGNEGIRAIGKDEAETAMNTLNIYTTAPFDKRHLVLEYCHYDKYDISGLLAKRSEIIRKFLAGVKCFELTSTNVADSEELIRKAIS